MYAYMQCFPTDLSDVDAIVVRGDRAEVKLECVRYPNDYKSWKIYLQGVEPQWLYEEEAAIALVKHLAGKNRKYYVIPQGVDGAEKLVDKGYVLFDGLARIERNGDDGYVVTFPRLGFDIRTEEVSTCLRIVDIMHAVLNSGFVSPSAPMALEEDD